MGTLIQHLFISQHKITAPKNGTIEAIPYRKGQTVQRNVELVKFFKEE